MTLIATPGAADANSFCRVSEALPLHLGRPGAAAFAAADLDIQEALLIQATLEISLKVTWLDAMVDPDVQALPLPMVGQVDAWKRALPEDIIPPLVVKATALYALTLFKAGQVEDQAALAAGIKQFQVEGAVSITFADPLTIVPSVAIPWEIWNLLRYYATVPTIGRHMAVVRG